MTQEEFDNAVLEITGNPNWAIIQKGLANDIYNAQASALDAKTWEEVNALRGFAQGLAFVINLRESVTRAKEINDAAV